MAHRQHLVLVVDDDLAVCEALRFALQSEGFSVRTYQDGTSLLNDTELVGAACIIVDERMPHLDGFDVLCRLRRQQTVLPAILITSHATPRLHSKAVSAGVRVVLEKPLLDNVLIASIQTIIAGLNAAGG